MIASESYSAWEERFGEEEEDNEVDSAETLTAMLGVLSPRISPEELLQWVALWEVAKTPDFMSGLHSGEQVNRAYTLRVPWSPDVSSPPVAARPRLLRVLHQDSSGQCVSNGQIGIFVHFEDGLATAASTCAVGGVDKPVHLVPLVVGSYSDGGLEWTYGVDGGASLLAAVLAALKDTNSRDATLRS